MCETYLVLFCPSIFESRTIFHPPNRAVSESEPDAFQKEAMSDHACVKFQVRPLNVSAIAGGVKEAINQTKPDPKDSQKMAQWAGSAASTLNADAEKSTTAPTQSPTGSQTGSQTSTEADEAKLLRIKVTVLFKLAAKWIRWSLKPTSGLAVGG